jgi:hypothetical protein
MMLAALLLAGTCALTPLFDNLGPSCSAANQDIECQCSECMEWSPVAGAEFYEIGRQDPGSQSLVIVGSTLAKNNYEENPTFRPTTWCFAWDAAMPAEGQLYLYRVRADAWGSVGGVGTLQFSAWSSRSVDYVAAPYRVWP